MTGQEKTWSTICGSGAGILVAGLILWGMGHPSGLWLALVGYLVAGGAMASAAKRPPDAAARFSLGETLFVYATLILAWPVMLLVLPRSKS